MWRRFDGKQQPLILSILFLLIPEIGMKRKIRIKKMVPKSPKALVDTTSLLPILRLPIPKS